MPREGELNGKCRDNRCGYPCVTMKTPRKRTECILCSSRDLEYEFMVHGSPLVRCQNCSFMFLNPPPTEMKGAGADTEERFERRFPAQNNEGEKSTVDAELNALIKYAGTPGKKMIELESRNEVFLEAAREKGFDVWGTNSGGGNTETINRTLREERVIRGHWESADLEKEEYDICVARDVLPYCDDPLRAVQKMHSLLKPGGVLFLTTVRVDDLGAEDFLERLKDFPVTPLSFFDSQTIQYALSKSGFSQIDAASVIRQSVPEISGSLRVLSRAALRRERPLLSVIVPVYNEKKTFSTLMERLRNKHVPGMDREIIIVESNSTDGTREDVRKYGNSPGIRVIFEDKPRGKGHAVRTGFAYASGDYVIIQDGDLEYDLNDYDILLEPLVSGKAAFVLGSRHGRSWKIRRYQQVFLANIMNLAHKSLVALMNVLYGQSMTDPFTMYKVFRRDCLFGIPFECDRFNFDIELVCKLIRKGYTPYEVKINYNSRSFAEGKKVRFFRDPPTWIKAIFKYRFTRVYFPCSGGEDKPVNENAG